MSTCNCKGCQKSCIGDVQEDIVNAMALTGQFLMGQAVMVKSSEVSLSSGVVIMPKILDCTYASVHADFCLQLATCHDRAFCSRLPCFKICSYVSCG